MRTTTRLILGGMAAAAAVATAATPALAGDCTNISKPPPAGVQVVIDANTGQLEWVSTGLQKRFDQGLVDPDTGEGFHGLVGFDINSDGVVDATTFIVTPQDELPVTAQLNGSTCHGIVNIEVLFSGQCSS